MSGLFSNLIARNSDGCNVVRPRTRARFEPTSSVNSYRVPGTKGAMSSRNSTAGHRPGDRVNAFLEGFETFSESADPPGEQSTVASGELYRGENASHNLATGMNQKAAVSTREDRIEHSSPSNTRLATSTGLSGKPSSRGNLPSSDQTTLSPSPDHGMGTGEMVQLKDVVLSKRFEKRIGEIANRLHYLQQERRDASYQPPPSSATASLARQATEEKSLAKPQDNHTTRPDSATPFSGEQGIETNSPPRAGLNRVSEIVPAPNSTVSSPDHGHPERPLLSAEMISQIQNRLAGLHSENRVLSKPEPVVNITIGRVDIRTTQPGAAKKTTRQVTRPSGVMSLDEYFKLREQEG